MFKDIESKLTKNNERQQRIEAKLDSQHKEITGLRAKVNSLQSKVSDIYANIKSVRKDIEPNFDRKDNVNPKEAFINRARNSLIKDIDPEYHPETNENMFQQILSKMIDIKEPTQCIVKEIQAFRTNINTNTKTVNSNSKAFNRILDSIRDNVRSIYSLISDDDKHHGCRK